MPVLTCPEIIESTTECISTSNTCVEVLILISKMLVCFNRSCLVAVLKHGRSEHVDVSNDFVYRPNKLDTLICYSATDIERTVVVATDIGRVA